MCDHLQVVNLRRYRGLRCDYPVPPEAIMPWLQGAQGNRSRLLQGTFYSTGIMVPYLCVLVGCHSHVGMDTTHNGRGWKDMSIEGTETKQLNRTNFFWLTRTAPAYYPATSSPQSKEAQHTRGRRRPLRPEGLATLALRQLNRQPASVLALPVGRRERRVRNRGLPNHRGKARKYGIMTATTRETPRGQWGWREARHRSLTTPECMGLACSPLQSAVARLTSAYSTQKKRT